MKFVKIFSAAAISIISACGIYGQSMQGQNKPAVIINHISNDFTAADLNNSAWKEAAAVLVDRLWSGEPAPAGRLFEARLLWSDTALYVRFDAEQTEPTVVSDKPDLRTKTLGLWDRDVCEIFLAPNTKEPRKYYEFEVAPNGEWVDLFIDYTKKNRLTDTAYKSGMKSYAQTIGNRIVMTMVIGLNAFGSRPKAGSTWLGNLFRCVGREPNRGYLAYNPTGTAVPNFHVPEKFVKFEFRSRNDFRAETGKEPAVRNGWSVD